MTAATFAPVPTAETLIATPCDHITEVRYETAVRAIDSRGRWAEALAELVGERPRFEIKLEQVDVRNALDTETLFLGINHAGWQTRDLAKLIDLQNRTAAVLLKELGLLSAGQKKTLRIGCRTRVGIPFDGTFEVLRDRLLTHFSSPSQEVRRIFPTTLEDVAYVFSFIGPDGFHCNISCGPMKDTQIIENFQRDSEYRFEAVYLFIDLDSYFSYATANNLGNQAIVEVANKLHASNFEKLAALRNLVFGAQG